MAASNKGTEIQLPDGAVVVLRVDGAEMTLPLEARTFKSGSRGFYAQTKLQGEGSRRYQVGITATLIGSKPQA